MKALIKTFFIVIVLFVVGRGFIEAITPPQQAPAGLLAQQNISDGTIKRWGEEAAKLEQEAKERKVAAEEKAKRDLAEEKKNWKKEGVSIGMSAERVLLSNWGKPEKINRTTNKFGEREQWVYGSGNYLYFENGVLTSIQN